MHCPVRIVAFIRLRTCSHTNRTSSTVPGRSIRASRHQTFSESDTALRSGPVSLCPTLHPPASVPSRSHRVGMGKPFSRRRRPCRMHLHRQRRAHSNTGKRMARRCRRSGRSPPPRRSQFSSRARSPTCIFGATIRLFGHRVVQHRDVVQHSVSRVAHCKQRLALHSKQSSSTCYLAFSFPCYVLCIRLFIFNLSSVLLLPLPAILSHLLVRRSPTTVRKHTPWPFVGPG